MKQTYAEHLLWCQIGKLKQDAQMERNAFEWQRMQGVLWIIVALVIWKYVIGMFTGILIAAPMIYVGAGMIFSKEILQ